jgi:predicted GNAT superfamily acetyltransferase
MIQLRDLTSPSDMIALELLQKEVWPGSDVDIVPGHICQGIADHGGVLIGAFDGDQLVGFVLGVLGTDPLSQGDLAMTRLLHYSHQLGVHPDYRGQGLGFLLKSAQRVAVNQQGVRMITWTYDPLLSLNANLNIRQLGAICRTYLREYYGEMRDGLNIGLPSDRFVVEWWITSQRVKARMRADRKYLDLAHFIDAGAQRSNQAELDTDGLVRPIEQDIQLGANLQIVEIPSDYPAMRSQNPELALEWRKATRDIFENLFGAGFIVSDFIYFKEETIPRSYYILIQGDSVLG